MPSRVIRGEILSSDSLSRVSLEAEALFWRLLVAADDFGRLDGRIGVLRSVLFPARDVSAQKIERWLDELEHADFKSGPVARYVVNGRPYLQLVGWEQHRSNGKRASRSRFPDPPELPADPLGSPEPPEDPRPSYVLRGTSIEGRLSSAPKGASARSARAKTDPPMDLDPEQQEALKAWCRERHPDLEPRLADLTAACLDYHRSKGNRHADWLATARTWVRNEAQGRYGRQNGASQAVKRFGAPPTVEEIREAYYRQGGVK